MAPATVTTVPTIFAWHLTFFTSNLSILISGKKMVALLIIAALDGRAFSVAHVDKILVHELQLTGKLLP